MLSFTFRMMITDLQAVFKGFWVVVYFGLLSCFICLFYITDNPYTLLYVAFIVLSFLVPQLPKMFYVLPLGNKLIRRYLHLRGILSAFLLLSIGGIITLVSLRYPIPYPLQGWRILIMVVQICMLMSLIHVKTSKGRTTLLLTLLALLVAGNLLCVILMKDFILLLFISFLLLLATDIVTWFVLKAVQLTNFTEPVYGYFYHNKKLRQENQEGGRSK